MKRLYTMFFTYAIIATFFSASLIGQVPSEISFDDDYYCEEEEEDFDQCDFCTPYRKPGHCVYLGPEVYHTLRIKKGGSRQKGVMAGIRGGYDYIKRYCFYWGLEGSYAQGRLEGFSRSGAKIVSNLTDAEVEGRFGYTLQLKGESKATFIPFVGLGYFQQNNNFRAPSPIPVHYCDSFKYAVLGFLSQVNLTPDLTAGITFKTKFMLDGKSKINHDPEFEDSTLLFDDENQYSVDIPLLYQIALCDKDFELGLVPFFQYRHYGNHENFPFDFIETKYINFGGRLLLLFRF